ncbi:MAG: flagellar hook capping protein [Desulfobacterales bacterium]|nr:flagellar hook capping protein [Desulfobacterales bacterium]
MTVSTSNSTLENISSSYVSHTSQQADAEETLGREEFLTLLVAQLENQDPLNPQEGTDFTAQLAEYSQLEQLMNLNDTMDNVATAYESGTQSDGVDYIGKEVTGYIDSIEVTDGTVTSGFYNLNAAADVMVDIYDSDGNKVTRLYEGQMSSGGQLVSWDGTDSTGEAVTDGQYTYKVLADYGYGYETVETSVTGTVQGVTYNNGTPYLVVQGVLISIDDVTSVTELNDESEVESIMDYLGNGVKSSSPIVLVEDGEVYGGELEFDLETVEPVTIKIYDAYDELVNTITMDADELQEGTNSKYWNALSSNGSQMNDGLYYYTVETDSGESLSTDVAEEVSAIKNVNNTQYLVLSDSGRLVALSNVEEIY